MKAPMHGMEDMAEEDNGEDSSSSERPITEENTPEDSGDTLHVPSEFCAGMEFKPGDEITMKVVSVGDDGVEVAYAKPEDSNEKPDSRESANAELDSMGDGY